MRNGHGAVNRFAQRKREKNLYDCIIRLSIIIGEFENGYRDSCCTKAAEVYHGFSRLRNGYKNVPIGT